MDKEVAGATEASCMINNHSILFFFSAFLLMLLGAIQCSVTALLPLVKLLILFFF